MIQGTEGVDFCGLAVGSPHTHPLHTEYELFDFLYLVHVIRDCLAFVFQPLCFLFLQPSRPAAAACLAWPSSWEASHQIW